MPHPVDIHVGKRIRARRWAADQTQKCLAEKVGVRFQQIQKYEVASNRVSASRLWDISKVLNVDVTYFFEGLDTTKNAHTMVEARKARSQYQEAIELLRVYYKIPEHQRSIFTKFVKTLLPNTSETNANTDHTTH